MASRPFDPERSRGTFKRRLRAAFSADVANFSGNVSVSETRAFGNLAAILKVGREELENHEGVLIGVPGDGLFALFESVVNAVQCAITMQKRLAADVGLGSAMRLRIGIHLGDVLFDGDLPFGETLNIAARLQALADPGSTLVSGAVVDAVSAHVSATFQACGVPQLKNIPRRIATFSVHPRVSSPTHPDQDEVLEPLDHTMQLPSRSATGGSGSASSAEERDDTDSKPRSIGRLPTRPCGSALDEPPTAETIAVFGDAIAVHLGPVGRLMTARKAKSCASLADLLAALEKEIPTPVEQHIFRSRIKRQFEP
jgi:class 3 adenylate cyclase